MVSRLGDVFGPMVNIASRLTSVARPGTVLVDRGAYEALSGSSTRTRTRPARRPADPPRAGAGRGDGEPGAGGEPADRRRLPGGQRHRGSPYRFRRMRRSSVKGYSKLQSWVLRRA